MKIWSVRAPVRVLLIAVLGGAGCGDAATAAVSDALTASADIVSDSGAGIGATSDATAADGDAAGQVGADGDGVASVGSDAGAGVDGDAGDASEAVDAAPVADTSEAEDMDSGTVVAADSATELGADSAASKCNPASPCPTPASVCQYAACEPAVGCLAIALPDGTVCDDSNPCTAGSVCGQGVCTGGPPISCDDKNPCTKDSCAVGACVFLPLDGTLCDDDSPCTIETACKSGQCSGGISVCQCQKSADCAAQNDGNLCNGSLFCDQATHLCSINPATVVGCVPGDNPCTVNSCNPTTGTCAAVNLSDGATCSDGKVCTVGDACKSGNCAAGTNVCCTSNAECAASDDGNLCNGSQFCNKQTGTCQLNPLTVVICPTVDDNACSKTTCNSKTGKCGALLSVEGSACDDGNPCTQSACKGGACAAGTNTCGCQNNADCLKKEDGDVCNGTLFCDFASATCKVNPTTVIQCPVSDSSCKLTSCDPISGKCLTKPSNAGGPCDADGNTCTNGDSCEAGQCVAGGNVCGCQKNADCLGFEDGDPCNGTLYCDQIAKTCKVNPATVVQCLTSGDTTCAVTACNPASGKCASKPRNELQACEADGNPCTASDHCEAGACILGPNLCKCQNDSDCKAIEDGDLCNGSLYCAIAKGSCAVNPATPVTCATGEDTACVHSVCEPKTGKCKLHNYNELGTCDADGNPCTLNDRCLAGQCLAGNNVCQCGTDQSCGIFNDLDLCNGSLLCGGIGSGDGGLCAVDGKTVVACPPGSEPQCTVAKCGPNTGKCTVLPLANGKQCDDGIACTGGDACVGGVCIGTTAGCDDQEPCTLDTCEVATQKCKHVPMSCDDGAPCTTDSCSVGMGCVHTALVGSCQDGNACTADDFCKQGACLPGTTTTSCDDGNTCTGDACSPIAGCVYSLVTGPCSDGDPCSLGDSCAAGACKGATTLDCGDANSCTQDTCQAKTGCIHLPQSSTCTDDNVCTISDTCSGGVCKGGGSFDCQDGDLCTTDACSPTKGCTHTPSTGPCDDGQFCTVADTCSSDGLCSGKTRDCQGEVGGPCANGLCDEKADICVASQLADGSGCDDGFECTLLDLCKKGTCVGANDVCVEEQLSSAGTAYAQPSVVGLPAGGYAVQWVGGNASYVRFVDGNGSRFGEEIRLDDGKGGLQYAPKLAAKADGSVIAAWWAGVDKQTCGTNGCGQGFNAFRFTTVAATGSVAVSTVVGNPVDTCAACTMELSRWRLQPLVRPDGGIAFAQSLKLNPAQNSQTVLLQKGETPTVTAVSFISYAVPEFDFAPAMDDPSQPWVVMPVGYNLGARRVQLPDMKEVGYIELPKFSDDYKQDHVHRAVGLASGGVVVAMSGIAKLGGSRDVVLMAATGIAGSVTHTTIAGTESTENAADLALFSDTSLVATWSDNAGDGSGAGVKAQRFSSKTLLPLENSWIVNSKTSGDQRDSAVAKLLNDEFVIAFRDAAGTLWTRVFGKDGKPAGTKLEKLAAQITESDQTQGAVAAQPDGTRALIAWSGPVPGSDPPDVRGRVVDGNGKPIGAEFALATTTDDIQSTPQVAAGTGRFVAVWQSYGQDGSQDGVVGRVFDYDGKPKTNEVLLAAQKVGSQRQPVVAMLPQGQWFAAWISDDPSTGFALVKGRAFDKSGAALTDELTLSATTDFKRQNPAIAVVGGSTEFAVLWDYNANGPHVINGRRVSILGSMNTLPQFSLTGSGVHLRPTVASSASGTTRLCYYGSHTGPIAIRCATLTTSNMSHGLDTTIVSAPTVSVAGPQTARLTALAGGQFGISWSAQGVDGSGTAVQYVRLDASNKVFGTRTLANRTSAGAQDSPFVAGLAGGLFVGWESENQDAGGRGIVYRVLP